MRTWLVGLGMFVVGCGGAPESRPPAGAPAAAAATAPGQAAGCKPLVERIEKLEHDTTFTDSENPMEDKAALGKALSAMDAAAKDLDALPPQDAKVSAIAKDYAAYVKERRAEISDLQPRFAQLTASAGKLREALTASEAAMMDAMAACKGAKDAKASGCPAGLPLQTNKADPEYPQKARALVDDLRKSKAKDAGVKGKLASAADKLEAEVTALEAFKKEKTEFDGYIQSSGVVERDKALHERSENLDERLHVTCGRPIPPKDEVPEPRQNPREGGGARP